jgi:hypothetical protein
MARYVPFGLTGVAALALAVIVASPVVALASPAPLETPGSLAATASPALVGQLSKEMGSSPAQAAGAAGALFGVAKSRLNAGDFSQVAKAVPGMDLLLKAAPAAAGKSSASNPLGAVSQLGGAAGGLTAAMGAFSQLGLSPSLVAKAIPVLTSFVTKSGGANVGSLLAGVLK